MEISPAGGSFRDATVPQLRRLRAIVAATPDSSIANIAEILSGWIKEESFFLPVQESSGIEWLITYLTAKFN